MAAAHARFAGISVLVVDDDAHMRKIIRSLLMGFGIGQVYEAGDGAQGLEQVHQFRPDVIVTDWEMPMLNGAEMVRLIRNPKTSPQATVPIILATAHTQRRRIQEALRLGVNEVLAKPFSAKSLMQRLDAVIHRPRPFLHVAGYFGPMPRDGRLAAAGRPRTAAAAE